MNWRYLLLALSCALNLLLLWALLWSGTGYFTFKELEREYTALNERIASLNAQRLALDREIRLLQSDPRYLEQVIRKRLNFVKDNELLYVFPDEHSEKAGPGAAEGVNESKN